MKLSRYPLDRNDLSNLSGKLCLLSTCYIIELEPSGRSRSRTRSPNPGRGVWGIVFYLFFETPTLVDLWNCINHLIIPIRHNKKRCKSNNKTVKNGFRFCWGFQVNDVCLNNLVVRWLGGLLMHWMPWTLSTPIDLLEASLIVVEWWFLAMIWHRMDAWRVRYVYIISIICDVYFFIWYNIIPGFLQKRSAKNSWRSSHFPKSVRSWKSYSSWLRIGWRIHGGHWCCEWFGLF